jgi:hypothetical protein
MIPLQNGILASTAVITTMEAGNIKTASENALSELRKSNEESRKQIFFLQVWRKNGRLIAVKYSRKEEGKI